MSWIFNDVKKRMNDAKSMIEQNFKESTTTDNEAEVNEEDGSIMRTSVSSIFDGLKVSGGTASTKIFEYAKDATKKLEVVKNAVIENTLIGDLNKEQNEFEKQIKGEAKNSNVKLPWMGLPDEDLAKKQMLSLSLDTRNFLRDSPVNSEYSYDEQQEMAVILIQEDPNLAKVRFVLVPKKIKENQFWKNYFYRIGLIRQSMINQADASKEEANVGTSKDDQCSTLSDEELSVDVTQSDHEDDADIAENENVADTATTEQPSAGDKTLTSVDEEWEKEILADLNDYNDVAEKTGKDEEEWEAEIQEMLKSEN